MKIVLARSKPSTIDAGRPWILYPCLGVSAGVIKVLMILQIENRLWVAKREWGGRENNWKFGISRCKLLYREWINNSVLLYCTRNYIPYPVINHSEKEYEKESIHISSVQFSRSVMSKSLRPCITTVEKNMKRMYIYISIWITLLYTRN